MTRRLCRFPACCWLSVLLAGLLTACSTARNSRIDAAQPWHQSRQMVLVLTDDWDAPRGRLFTFSRIGHDWEAGSGPFPVMLGRAGSAWGLGLHPESQGGPGKREGDGRSPAGVFAIGTAFGYEAILHSALDYRPMRASNWCVDVSGSPDYNRIVDTDAVGQAAVEGASERMRLDLLNPQDQRYRVGFVIEHNQQQAPMGGSCIFAHLWKDADTATAGCTAMAAATMQQLVDWLDPESKPVFVLLPEAEYRRLQHAWNLPGMGSAP